MELDDIKSISLGVVETIPVCRLSVAHGYVVGVMVVLLTREEN